MIKLTSGDLRCVPPDVGEANEALQNRKVEQQIGQTETTEHGTENLARGSDHIAEVSRGHSRYGLSARLSETLARKGRNGQGSQGRKRRAEGPNGRKGSVERTPYGR